MMTRKSLFSWLLLIAAFTLTASVQAQAPMISKVDIYITESITDIVDYRGHILPSATPLTATTAAGRQIPVGDFLVVAVTFDKDFTQLAGWNNMKIMVGTQERTAEQPRLRDWATRYEGLSLSATLYFYGPTGDAGVNGGDDSPNSIWRTVVYMYRVQSSDSGTFSFKRALYPFEAGSVRAKRVGGVLQGTSPLNTQTIAAPNWPSGGIDSTVPQLLSFDTHPVRFTDSSGAPIDNAQYHGGRSRYHEIRQNCFADHNLFGTAYTDACSLVGDDGWSKPELATSRMVYYYGLGDTIYISARFSEPVRVDENNAPTLRIHSEWLQNRHATYHSGSGTDTLVFRYQVQQEDRNFGGILFWSFFQHNDRTHVIRDLSGSRYRPLGRGAHTEVLAYYMGITDSAFDWDALNADARVSRMRQGEVGSKITNFLVDTLPPTVWIPGLIKNGETHTEDRRNAVVNLDPAWTGAPALTPDALRATVTESSLQTETFEVEFRFFNYDNGTEALADEIGESFTADDVQITGTNVVRDAWDVEVAYVGVDHRATNYYSFRGAGHDPGDAKNSAAFLVYKATLTPQLGFKGNVDIFLEQGAVMDIAGNLSKASNRLTVPIDTRLELTEAPEIVAPAAGAYAAGDEIEVVITYERENLRYIGENPPYLTLYLGEEVPANARHATWESAEDANSTKVTFAYEVAAADLAASVSVAPVGMTVPRGTRLLDDSGQALTGDSEPAKKSGEGLETLPPPGQSQFQFGASDQELAPRTEVPINLFIFFEEETEPKAAATNVPRSPIVFNELGNGSGDTNDWLEFRNVTGTAQALKDWQLSVVQDGKKEDTSLIVFPDVSVPANGLLLITNSDPTAEGNVLAGGDDVATSDAEKKGAPHRYLVNAGLSLPDDGKFLLILRNVKEKLGKDEAFVDVAGGGGSGTDAFVRETTGLYDTHIWPLQVLEAPGGNTEEALGSGKVWQRAKADIVGYHRDAWAEAAFTGIGYDRKVSQSAATAGTPGYPNVAPKAAAAKGSVTFSELMVDSGGGTLPQWIEVYNNSKTEVININRWKLEIQNVDTEDLVGRPIVTLTLQEKVIQPNQTLLIVAGPARASSDAYLPADRVYDLFALHEKNLRIKTARDTFLSAEGFYLKLWDSTGTLVDEVGNTDGDRRTQDVPAWPLSMSAEEGVRSSLIRRYTDGTSEAKDGTQRGNWVLAANVKKVVDGELHWGAAEDIGTPGFRAGGALPVELSSFTLVRAESGAVVLTWTTESEVDNAGFNLRRSEKRDGNFALINPALIAGAGTTGEQQTYTFTDTSAKPGVEYYYQIEEVSFGGKPETLAMRLLRGPVSAANRALVTFGEVKQRE